MSLVSIDVMSSGFLWAGLFGVLDGIEGGTDVVVFGLKESSQPATFISEAHRQHEGQRLHQTRVRLCGGRGRESGGGVTNQNQNKPWFPQWII